MSIKVWLAGWILLLGICMAWGQQAVGQIRVVAPARQPAGAGGGVVSLPYNMMDNQGNQWVFFQNGQFQMQGNMPVYSQGAMLRVNNAYPQLPSNQAKLDEKTGELVFEMNVGGMLLTRRVFLNKEDGYLRYIDIIRNPQNRDQTVNLALHTNTNYGVQFASLVADPKRKEHNLAWVAVTHANGRVVVEMFGGKAAKTVPTIQYQQGNNAVQAFFSPTVPGGKEIALMHFHYVCGSQDAGTRFVLEMKESKVLAGIPPAIRRLIVNFRGGENFVGDYEILRGDIQDVVELRSGDQLRGTLKETGFRLLTFYGPVELAVESVIGLINAGEFRPRQLLVTRDGQIFGGKLSQEKVTLELASGQVTEIPISQISRLGYRKRPDDPEEWTFDKPVVLMQTGDRIMVQMPVAPITFVTRYGQLALRPESVAAISMLSEEHGVHQVYLTDGSRFAGLVTGQWLEVKLAAAGPEQTVKFPFSSMRSLQLSAKMEDPGDDQAMLELSNEDMLVGSLHGELKLDTLFTTLTMNAEEIKRLVHMPASPSDVQVVLWDDTTVSGQLQEPEISCQLRSGLNIRVPVALVRQYVQPRPQPSAAAVEVIKSLVGQLNADDWKQRDQAQERLVAMGPAVIAVLRQLRPQQSPEAQHRIDLILKQLEGSRDSSRGTGISPGTPEPPEPAMHIMEDFGMLGQWHLTGVAGLL